jgi:hypothetical protein
MRENTHFPQSFFGEEKTKIFIKDFNYKKSQRILVCVVPMSLLRPVLCRIRKNIAQFGLEISHLEDDATEA